MIDTLVNSARAPQTPMQRELDELGKKLVIISLAICGLVFLIGLVRGRNVLQKLRTAISLAIAAVPEGLPTVATTAFAQGMRTMRDQKMLIRKLQAVETLGAIHAVCFDKTGTLTLNEMQVVMLETLSSSYGSGRQTPLIISRQATEGLAPDVARILDLCILSNENGEGTHDPASLSNGSATEYALRQFAREAGVDVGATLTRFPLLHRELRSENRKYMLTLHSCPLDDKRLLTVKGSPAEVLELCGQMHVDEGVVPVTDDARALILRQNAEMARRQLRVLGFAWLEQDDIDTEMLPRENLVWLGLVGLSDPIRPNMDTVIAQFHAAGIRTIMITGDQDLTAAAVAEHLSLAGSETLNVLDSGSLDGLAPSELRLRVKGVHAFARVSPARKLDIVRALQESGAVVAMVGDGVNDGPALRASDIGIAMGKRSTELARAAADVVLQDDRLETVLAAIRQGRTITGNVGRSLEFLLSSNLSEILTVLGAVATTGTAPLTPMQLLWINLLTDVVPAIALVGEPPESDVMQQPPRDPKKPLIGRPELLSFGRQGAVLAAGSLGAHLYGAARSGAGQNSSGIVFNTLVLGQLLHALTCRSHGVATHEHRRVRDHALLDLAVGGSLGLQLIANLASPLRSILGTGGTSLAYALVILAGGGVPFLINNASKCRRTLK